MMKKEEDQGQCSSQTINKNIQSYQEQLFIQQQIHQQQNYGQPWSNMPHHHNNHDQLLVSPIVPSSPYASFFNRRVPYEGPSSSSHHHHHHHHHNHNHEHLRIISDTIVGHSTPYGFQAEFGKLSAQEIMEAKALAASKSHSEAERRRRERINNHLAKLRSLLPNTTKTDKASLLAEVIQHVKELKRQTSLIAETNPVPTETDELMVDDATSTNDEEGKFVIKASLCCEDRSDLLPDLIKTLKALRLRTLKAEITTLGGRVKNVLFITGDDVNNDTSSNTNSGDQNLQHYPISSIQEALKIVMAKSGDGDETTFVKRQRTNNISMLEQRSS